MKLQILSDLHIDSYRRRGLPEGMIPDTDAEVVLVAGDTCNGAYGLEWLQTEAERLQKPIVAILGNHEYFDEDIVKFDGLMKRYETYDAQTGQGLKLLQCEHIDIGDVRIYGCTLWTDYQYDRTDETMDMAIRFMHDYDRILYDGVCFSPELSIKIHQAHRQWLAQALQESHAATNSVLSTQVPSMGALCGTTLAGAHEAAVRRHVVMTHHSITPRSVSAKYANLPSNAAFVSDLSAWMHQPWSPSLWIHGHTHEAFDYVEGNTRVIVNPRAYPGEVSSTGRLFDWALVVEV